MTATSPVIAVHAGAGEWSDDADTGIAACAEALEAGVEAFAGGASALDAVVAAVRVFEDNPQCNAGTGAVLTSTGELELDASIMDGSALRSGAVGALPPFEHPVDIARAVLEDGRYHLLTGDGAAQFAQARGFVRADPEQMITERRRTELRQGIHTTGNTVGAVACDSRGHLASATSTGGIAGTEPGRLGDTPIIGAGTYANSHGACSCTGHGEAFARACAAFWATEHVRKGPQRSADEAVAKVRDDFGGYGGLILLDFHGEVGIARTAANMPHGIGRPGSKPVLGI
jgi:L-asparaginase / beta-aspartyl-peptidase